MSAWVCLLRAINVGGRNKVPMAGLRHALAEAGFADVRTYLQSGNVVLESAGDPAARVRDVITEVFGLAVPVITRPASAWEHVVRGNPFPVAANDRPKILHALFLPRPPDASAAAALHAHELARDACRVDGDVVYVDFGDRVHDSKLNPVLARTLGPDGTARNWRTVLALRDMIG